MTILTIAKRKYDSGNYNESLLLLNAIQNLVVEDQFILVTQGKLVP